MFDLFACIGTMNRMWSMEAASIGGPAVAESFVFAQGYAGQDGGGVMMPALRVLTFRNASTGPFHGKSSG